MISNHTTEVDRFGDMEVYCPKTECINSMKEPESVCYCPMCGDLLEGINQHD